MQKNISILIFMLAFSLILPFHLTKPLHIDDPIYYENAVWIAKNPLLPLSTKYNWGGIQTTAFKGNHPFLWPAIIAILYKIFGENFIVLHFFSCLLAASLATFFWYCLKYTNRHFPEIFILILLLILGPGILPGINIMPDIPLLAMLLFTLLCYIKWNVSNKTVWLLVGMLVSSIACLIKYTAIFTLLLPVVIAIYKKKARYLLLISIPIVIFILWSLWNIKEIGSIHLLQTRHEIMDIWRIPRNFVDWFTGLGSISIFVLPIIISKKIPKQKFILILCSIFCCVSMFIAVLLRAGNFLTALTISLFYGNGILVTLFAGWIFIDLYLKYKEVRNIPFPALISFVLLVFSFVFVILTAPFMAIRHIILALPFLMILLCYGNYNFLTKKFLYTGFLPTIITGIMLAISDYKLAKIYPAVAFKIAGEFKNCKVWFDGHSGWQFYALKAGLYQYDVLNTEFNTTDLLILPQIPDKQFDPSFYKSKFAFEVFTNITVKGSFFTIFRTMPFGYAGGYYAFSTAANTPPWTLQISPMENFSVFRIKRLL